MGRAENIAVKIMVWWACAAGEMAYEMVNGISCDDGVRKKIRKAEENGVLDIAGWLADEIFKDKDYYGMIADRIADECSLQGVDTVEVYKELAVTGCESVREYAKERIEREIV